MEPIPDCSARYYTKSNISFLQLRVLLRELSQNDVFWSEIDDVKENVENEEDASENDSYERKKRKGNKRIREERVIKWQEKVFSTRERNEFKKEKYKTDSKYSSYYLKATEDTVGKPNRIFTYCNKDDFHAKKHPVTTSTLDVNPETTVRNRFKKSNSGSKSISNDMDEIEHFSTFYIMADLSNESSSEENYEIILCRLRYDSRGELLVDPNFTGKGRKPYRIEGIGTGSAAYEYLITNVSLKSKDDLSIPMKSSKSKISQILQEPRVEFSELSPGFMNFCWFGEILRGLNFTDTTYPIYLHYMLDVPEGWILDGNSTSEGLSESCHQIYKNGQYITHFSLPLTFQLTRTPKGVGWPCLLLSAFSKEWLRHDMEQGYAAIQLPNQGMESGCVEEVHTWRPAQVTPIDKLRRYFVGGTRLINDPSYLNPIKNNKQFLSHLGFQTESSGSIEVRLNLIHQASVEEEFSPNIEIDEKFSSFTPSTIAVIRAFHKSFRKLREAKRSLKE